MNDQAGAEAATEAPAVADAVTSRWSENHDEAFSREVFWLAIRGVRDRYRFKATGGETSGTWTSYLVRRFPRGGCSLTACRPSGLRRKGYGVAWCNAILHHIERLEFVLDEVHASLAPGGWLFVE